MLHRNRCSKPLSVLSGIRCGLLPCLDTDALPCYGLFHGQGLSVWEEPQRRMTPSVECDTPTMLCSFLTHWRGNLCLQGELFLLSCGVLFVCLFVLPVQMNLRIALSISVKIKWERAGPPQRGASWPEDRGKGGVGALGSCRRTR